MIEAGRCFFTNSSVGIAQTVELSCYVYVYCKCLKVLHFHVDVVWVPLHVVRGEIE